MNSKVKYFFQEMVFIFYKSVLSHWILRSISGSEFYLISRSSFPLSIAIYVVCYRNSWVLVCFACVLSLSEFQSSAVVLLSLSWKYCCEGPHVKETENGEAAEPQGKGVTAYFHSSAVGKHTEGIEEHRLDPDNMGTLWCLSVLYFEQMLTLVWVSAVYLSEPQW